MSLQPPYTTEFLKLDKAGLIEIAKKYIHYYDIGTVGCFELPDLYYVYNMILEKIKSSKGHCGISCTGQMIEELRKEITNE